MCYLHIPLDLIKGGRIKEDVNEDQVRVFFHVGIVVDVMIQSRNFFGVLVKFNVLCKRILIICVTFLDGL